jgi:hypothetical protein
VSVTVPVGGARDPIALAQALLSEAAHSANPAPLIAAAQALLKEAQDASSGDERGSAAE